MLQDCSAMQTKWSWDDWEMCFKGALLNWNADIDASLEKEGKPSF